MITCLMCVQLHTHCEDVDAINAEQLRQLSGHAQRFSAQDTGSSDLLDSACPVRSTLHLFLSMPCPVHARPCSPGTGTLSVLAWILQGQVSDSMKA